MKKLSRFSRFSLKAFLIFVFFTAAVFAWLARTQIVYHKELARIESIKATSVEGRNAVFETRRKQGASLGEFAEIRR